METTITGLFPDAESARRARLELEQHGTPAAAIEVLTPDTANLHALLGEETADAARGGTVGSVTASIGLGLAGAMLSLPPVSLFGGHWLISGCLGAMCGAAAGGLIGVLIGSGTGHQVQAEYEAGIERGGTVVAVNTDRAHADATLSLLRRCGGASLSTSVHRKHQLHATA
jgi:hypothetical protein